MICNPYGDLVEYDPAFARANFSGLLYTGAKVVTLAGCGTLLYQAPSPSHVAIGLTTLAAFGCCLTAAVAAAYERKSESAYEVLRQPRNPNEEMIKSNWLALWTCYSLAAILYGKPSNRLAIQDMKILAIKISQIASGIGAGLLVGWLVALEDDWNWKATMGSSMVLATCLIYFFLYKYEAFPKLSIRARLLLEEAIENCPPPPEVTDPLTHELRPIIFSSRAQTR